MPYRYFKVTEQCWFKTCHNKAVELVWFKEGWKKMCAKHVKEYRKT